MVQARVLDRGTLEGDTRYRMDLAMAEKLDPRQVVTFEELLRAMMFETEATRRVLVRKGLLTNEEVLEEIKVVRRELEAGTVSGRQQ